MNFQANLSAEINGYMELRLQIQSIIRQVVIAPTLDTILRDRTQSMRISGLGMQLLLLYAGPQQVGVFHIQPDGQRLIFVYPVQELLRSDNPVFFFRPVGT